jgi:hypothetical protein
MSQVFGSEVPRKHTEVELRKAARYLVLIDSGGSAVARLFLDTREQVAEFDASTEETVQMTNGLTPSTGANGDEWHLALMGHSVAERATAQVYTLGV